MHLSNLDRRLILACVGLLGLPAFAAEQPAAMPATDAIRVLLAADIDTTLSSQMSGTLTKVDVALGQKVSKGTLLAQFNCSEAQARTKVAAAELIMAKQNLDAKRSLRKLDAVGDLEVAMASTEVEKASGAQSLAQSQSSYCQVLAPFDGHVAKVYAKPYQTVSAGTPLLDLVSDGALKVRLNVPSVMLKEIKPAQPLLITILETGKQYPARISAINARVDAVAQSIELEARFQGEHSELIAGMTGTADISQP